MFGRHRNMRRSGQMLPLQAVILASMSLAMVVSVAMGEVADDKCKCLMCVCDVDPHPLPPAMPARRPPPSEPEPEPVPTPKYYPPPSEPEPVYYPPTTKPEPTPVYYYTPPSEPEATPGYYYTPPAVHYGYPWGADTYGTPGQMYPPYYPSSAHRSLCSRLLAYFVMAAGVLSLLTCRP